MRKYKSIAFDLDDTLLDTSGILVPAASRRACEAMLKAGLQCTLDECLHMRHEMASQQSHTEIFTLIAQKYGATDSATAVAGALQEFYNPAVPTILPLMNGAIENLEYLKNDYDLFLVTMGSKESQEQKIKALNIAHHFKKIYILNGFIGEKKDIAFRDILATKKHPAHELLSIGNRLSSEIRDGKRVGADTCYFAYGEHVGEAPQFPEDHPDFTITTHKELVPVCGL